MINTIQSHDRVGLDTSIFIYLLEGARRYADLVASVFEAMEVGALHGVTSIVTLMELAIRPIQIDEWTDGE